MSKDGNQVQAVSLSKMKGCWGDIPSFNASICATDSNQIGDKLVRRCASLMAVDALIQNLTERWCDLEHQAIAKYPNWWAMTDPSRSTLPEGQKMADLERTRAALFGKRSEILASLPHIPATTLSDILGKIVIAALNVRTEDMPVIHRLLADSACDLAQMRCPDCNHTLTTADARSLVHELAVAAVPA